MRENVIYIKKYILTVFIICVWLLTIKPIMVCASSSGNTSFYKAMSVSVNTSYTDNLSTSTDINYYKFTLSQAGCVSISFSHDYVDKTGNYWILGLYDSNEKKMTDYSFAGRSSTTFTSAKFGLPDGTYYIVVKKSSYSNVNYKLRVNYNNEANWETEHNETFYTSDNISLNSKMHGSIYRMGDLDFYRFTISERGYVSLSFSHAYVDKTGNYWASTIYDENEEMIAEYTYVGRSEEVSNSAMIGLKAGTYYIRIKALSWADIQYDFQVSYQKSQDWEMERNETAYTSTPISVGKAINGSTCRSFDVDYYKLQVFESGYYTVNFAHPYVNKSIACWILSLYNNSSKCLKSVHCYGNKTTESMPQIYLSSGIYYVKVEKATSLQDVTYSLRVDQHIHNYNIIQSVTKATLSKNGKKVMKCSCGAVGSEIPIYYPRRISLSNIQFPYNGKRKKPAVTVEDVNGGIISSDNYAVKYEKDSKDVGRYYVKVTFKGNYSGSKTKHFSIVPKGTKIVKLKAKKKGISIKIKKQRIQTTGYQIQYSLDRNFKKSKTKTIKKNTQASLVIKGLKAKKEYYVRIRTYKAKGNKKFYSSWSAVKAIKTKK